jgi:hypothetical protein
MRKIILFAVVLMLLLTSIPISFNVQPVSTSTIKRFGKSYSLTNNIYSHVHENKVTLNGIEFPSAPLNGTYTCTVGPYPKNFVGDVVLGIVYWSIPSSMEGNIVRISTNTNGHNMTVEIWTGFVKSNESEWWVTNAPIIMGSRRMRNPSLTWMAHKGNYTLAFAHWPTYCGCNEWEVNITYTIEVYSPTLSERAKNMFNFVFISLRVLDSDENPINKAQVKCYSEDWFVRYPDTTRGECGFALTNENGWVNFKIPVGNWTFFASAGEIYESKKPGLGYFVTLRNIRISENTSFILKPDDVIDLTIADVNGNPIDGHVIVMVSDYVPIIEVPRSGITKGGHISIHVSRDFSYDILFLKEPSVSKVGYIIHEKIGQARAVSIRPPAESLSQLTFRLYDKQYKPTVGFLNLFYHNFSVNGWTANWEISDSDKILLTPSKIWASLHLLKDGWRFSFYGSEYFLSPGSVKTISLGGPFTPQLRISIYDEEFKETGLPQIWLQVNDSFGNLLENFWDTRGEEDIPLDLLQNGITIFSENLGSRRVHSETDATPWMQIRIKNAYSRENSPEYKLKVNMGPFGTFELTGVLLSNKTLLSYESIMTEHFILRHPAVLNEKFMKVALWLESAYKVLSNLLNESIKEKIMVDFHICWGFFAGSNRIWFNFGDVLWDNYSPNDAAAGSQVARAGGLLHELAHVFQLSDSNIKKGRNYYEPWWFGEPFASMLAGEVIWSLLGEKAGMMAFGERNRISFDFLLKPEWAADFQHIPYSYLRKHYGTKIHRGMIKLWAGIDEDHSKDKLIQRGFSENEIYVTLYSYLAQQNLAWLFQAALPDVSEKNIVHGLTILQDHIPPNTLDDYDGEWQNSEFIITLTATDYESGVSETYYRVNNGVVKSVSVNGQPLITTEDANNTLEYWSVDNVGNEEFPHKILTGIKLDKTPPAILITSPSLSYEARSSTLTVTWTGSDEISGISHYEIRLDRGAWINVGTNTTYIFAQLADGSHIIDIKAVDKTGNVGQSTVSFTVNTSPLLGPGYIEAVITATTIIVALGIALYFLKIRKRFP